MRPRRDSPLPTLQQPPPSSCGKQMPLRSGSSRCSRSPSGTNRSTPTMHSCVQICASVGALAHAAHAELRVRARRRRARRSADPRSTCRPRTSDPSRRCRRVAHGAPLVTVTVAESVSSAEVVVRLDAAMSIDAVRARRRDRERVRRRVRLAVRAERRALGLGPLVAVEPQLDLRDAALASRPCAATTCAVRDRRAGRRRRDRRRSAAAMIDVPAPNTVEELRVRVLRAAAVARRGRVLAALRGLVAEELLAAAVGAVRHRIVARRRAVGELVLVIEAERVRASPAPRSSTGCRRGLPVPPCVVRERERDHVVAAARSRRRAARRRGCRWRARCPPGCRAMIAIGVRDAAGRLRRR